MKNIELLLGFFKSKKILSYTLIAIAGIFLALWIKDLLISYSLSKTFKMPVSVRGLGLGFSKVSLDKIPGKLNLAYLSIGEGPAKVNLQNISISDLKANPSSPQACVDGHAAFRKFYMGARPHKSCFGEFDFYCLPVTGAKNITTNLRNGNFTLGQSTLSASGKLIQNEALKLNLGGALSKGKLNDTLACLNSGTDEIKSDFLIPNFNLNYTASDKIDPKDSLTASGSFVFYQGKFKVLDLVDPIMKELKIKYKDQASSTKEFDALRGNFSVAKEVVYFSNLDLNSDVYGANGTGQVKFNGDIDFKLNIRGVDALIPSKELGIDKFLPKGLIPVRVTGTAEKPVVKPNPRGMINTIAPPVLNGAMDQVDKALNKGLNKLFGQ